MLLAVFLQHGDPPRLEHAGRQGDETRRRNGHFPVEKDEMPRRFIQLVKFQLLRISLLCHKYRKAHLRRLRVSISGCDPFYLDQKNTSSRRKSDRFRRFGAVSVYC